jgi:hypothetical protein
MIEKAPLVVTGACHDLRVGSPEKLLNIIPFAKGLVGDSEWK